MSPFLRKLRNEYHSRLGDEDRLYGHTESREEYMINRRHILRLRKLFASIREAGLDEESSNDEILAHIEAFEGKV